MADNTTLNVGVGGDVAASDDIAGIKYQRIKLVLGADGVNGGDVASGNPLPISDNAGSLTVDAPVGTPAFVRLSDGSAAISTLPVSLATLPTLAAGVNNIGDVDVLTLPALVAGSALIGKVGIDQTTPGTTNNINMGTVGSTAVNAFPAGFQRTTDEPKQIFYDPFDAALDTTNTWTTPTVTAPGVIAAVSAGVMTMGAGATASGWSKLTSQSTFKLSVPAWTGHSFAIAIPDMAAINANTTRFWGCGSIPATPTVGVPITDGVGFELSSGKMYAVVYAAGVRTQIQDMSAATGNALAPTDTAYHRYIVTVRTDRTYWYIDGLGSAQLAATSSFQSPQVQTLAQTFVAVGSASNVAAANIQCAGAAVWDTGKNTTQLADGAFPWRKQTVKAGSTAAAAADLPAVVALHPTSPLPAGTAVIGALSANQSVNTAQINGVAPLMGTGISGTGAQRVTLATDIALPAGTNIIGALSANQSTNIAQMNGVAVTMGSGISGTGVQRVTLATDIPLPPAAAASATYSAAIVGLASALTATDIFTITGSATKTVRVSRIMVNGVQTTAAQVNVLIIKRSTANSAGTSTAPTAVSYDSANAAATATVLAYTANPTLGTAVGTASARRAFIPGAATASDAQGLEIVSGDVGQQMMTLRGTAQVLAVNLNATTVTGSAFNITVEWTES